MEQKNEIDNMNVGKNYLELKIIMFSKLRPFKSKFRKTHD